VESRLINPPACKHAATNSAQYHDDSSVARGQIIDRIIPIELNGLPICWCAHASMAIAAFCEQPICRY